MISGTHRQTNKHGNVKQSYEQLFGCFMCAQLVKIDVSSVLEPITVSWVMGVELLSHCVLVTNLSHMI